MKNVAYYHVYLDDMCTWAQIFAEQMRCLERSKLIDNLSSIKITAITQEDDRIQIFKDFCSLYSVRFEIELFKNVHRNDHEMMQGWSKLFEKTNNVSETYTLAKIYRDSQNEDFNALYFHMKGITSTLNNLLVKDRMSKYKNRYEWRQFMNWGVLTEWKKCVDALSDYDVAGVDYTEEPSRHFRGNFFWAKSEYIRTLPDPQPTEWWENYKKKINDSWMSTVTDRFRDEQWLCYNENVKAFNLCSNNGHYIANDI